MRKCGYLLFPHPVPPPRCFRLTLSWELGWLSEEAFDPGIRQEAQRGKNYIFPQYLPLMDSLRDRSQGEGPRLTACDCLSLCKLPAMQTPNQSDSSWMPPREGAPKGHG